MIDDSFPIEPFEKLGYSVEVYGQKSYNGVAIISKIKPENVKKDFTVVPTLIKISKFSKIKKDWFLLILMELKS